MTTGKKLGIWMDHSRAHLMEFTTETIETNIITSKFIHQETKDSIRNSETWMYNKNQQYRSDFYKKLGEVIKNHEEVTLFGTTNAKDELLNVLKADHRFAKIKIEIQQTD